MKLACMTMVAVAALVAANTASASDQKDAGKPAKPKVTCRSYSVIGSNIPQSVCQTDAQWQAFDAREKDVQSQNRDVIDRDQRRLGYQGPGL